MPQKIYIVIEEFHDFGEIFTDIKGVFDNAEEAEAHCKIINSYDTKDKTKSVHGYIF